MPSFNRRRRFSRSLSPFFRPSTRAVDDYFVSDPVLSPFWQGDLPLILASKSVGRRRALAQAGLPFDARPADIDERAIEARLGDASPDTIAATLARAKALAISIDAPSRLVIGADQVASCEDRIFGKPANMADAKELLRFLSGRAHRLHSALTLARDGEIIFETMGHADLTMRELSASLIDAYLFEIKDAALASAGAYQIEELGVHLFSKVEGDHWTIMGLPLLPLLDALRREGALLS